jgi:AcrR family transcriptional regulator
MSAANLVEPTVTTKTKSRPAHRPSRRASVIDAAIGLFASYPPESITVADIAAAANMTAAAVYYHFPSKERILLEGLQDFTRAYLAEVRALLREDGQEVWAPRLIAELLEWLQEQGAPAEVFFARSSGLDMNIEALRRETRNELVVLLSRAIRSDSPRTLTRPEVGVAAIGLLALIETAATSWLTQDTVFRGLGPQRFINEASRAAERIIGSSLERR